MSDPHEVSFQVSSRARWAQLLKTAMVGGLAALGLLWGAASFFEQAPPALALGVLPTWLVGSAIHYLVGTRPLLRDATRTIRFGDEGITLLRDGDSEFFAYAWLGTSLVAKNTLVLHDRTMRPVARVALLDAEARKRATQVAHELERHLPRTSARR